MADKLFKVSTKDTYNSVCSLLDKGWVVKDMKPDAEGGIWVCLTDTVIREYNRSKIEENTTRFRGDESSSGLRDLILRGVEHFSILYYSL